MAKARLADAVAARAAERSPKLTGFFSRLPPEAQAELLEVRRRHQAGELGISCSALAGIVVATAQEQGLAVCGEQGMRVWLARRD